MNQNPRSHERWLAAADRVEQLNSEQEHELMHYASKYYDPIKAHEYYMQHRKLKGRRKTSSLSQEGREVWNVTKSNISTEKKSAVEKMREKQKKETAALRARAKQTRERISNKLKLLNDALTRKAKNERKRLSDANKAQIEHIRNTKPPPGLTKAEKAEWDRKQRAKIANVRENTDGKKKDLSTDTASNKTSNRESAKEQREKVGTELKAALKSTREKFNAAKKNLNDSYEKVYDSEYDKIAKEYPKEASKKSSSKKSNSKKSNSKKSSSNNSAPVDTSARKAQLEAERQARINRAVKKARAKK